MIFNYWFEFSVYNLIPNHVVAAKGTSKVPRPISFAISSFLVAESLVCSFLGTVREHYHTTVGCFYQLDNSSCSHVDPRSPGSAWEEPSVAAPAGTGPRPEQTREMQASVLYHLPRYTFLFCSVPSISFLLKFWCTSLSLKRRVGMWNLNNLV